LFLGRRQYLRPILHTGATPALVLAARVVVVRPVLPDPAITRAWSTQRFGPAFHTGESPPPVRVVPFRVVQPVLPLEGSTQAWSTKFLGPPVWSTRRAFNGDFRGLHRVEDTNAALLHVFRGVDASPDLDAAAWLTVARGSLPATGALAAGATYHIVVQEANQHGVRSANAEETLFIIAGDGSQTTAPPTAPYRIACSAAASGAVRVEASYNRAADGDNAADQWVLWQTDDGSEPDDTDPPTAVVDMTHTSSLVHLDRTAGSFGDGLTVKTLLRTRRSADTSDSENSTAVSCTANTDGPATPTAMLLVPPFAEDVQADG